MDELYAVGWRSAGRPRKWVWSVFPSLGLAVLVARGHAACDGGGRWRVYGTRVAGAGAGTVEAVLGRRLAEGLETRRQDGGVVATRAPGCVPDQTRWRARCSARRRPVR